MEVIKMTLDEQLAKVAQWVGLNGIGLQRKVRGIYEKELVEVPPYCISPERLKAIQEISGVPIPEDLIQIAYARIFSNFVSCNRHDDSMSTGGSMVRTLIEATGYQPKVDTEIVQQTYRSLLSPLTHDFDQTKRNWEGLEEMTSIKASEEVVQEGYAQCLNEHLADYVWGCSWGSGKVESGKAFSWLREKTGFPLGAKVEEKLQQIYEGLMPTNPFDGCVSKIIRLVKNTSILPKEETLQRIYQSIFDHEFEDQLAYLVGATGIKFSIPREAVQQRYKKHLEAGDRGFLRYIPPLMKATGIKPEFQKEEVHKIQRKLLEEGKFEEYLLLKRSTEVELPNTQERTALVHGL